MRPFDPDLLRSLPATRGPVAWLSAVGVLAGAVAIGQAVALALVVDAVVSGGELTAYLTLLVALLVLRGVLAGVGEVVARRAGLRVVGLVRVALLRHWLARPVEQPPRTEVAVTRATDGVAALEPYVARYLPALVTAAVVPALAVLALLVVDPWSALIVVLTLPLLPVFAALIGAHTRDQTQRRWGAMELLAGHFLDVMRGLPTLVAYGRAEAQVDVVREVGERHRKATVVTLRTAFLSTAALELLATISVAMVAVAVGLRLAHGGMELVVGLTAILLAPEAYWPIRRVGAEFHNAADGAQVVAELAEEGVIGAVDSEPEVTASPGHAEPGERAGHGEQAEWGGGVNTVGLARVSYAHPGRTRTLTDLSLRTSAGPGLTAVTGPSGSGKTTILELLAGLRTPAEGVVSVPANQPSGVHLATQRPLLLPGTVRDNLALVGTASDESMVAALEHVGLWGPLCDRAGLDTPLGDDGLGLSAGQRARLALARALLSDASLVLLDEPTANVDADGIPALHEVILELALTRRVVVVTHDPALAAIAQDRWRLEEQAADSDHEFDHRNSCPGTRSDGRKMRSERTAVPQTQTTSPQATPAQATSTQATPTHITPVRTPSSRRGLVLACLLGGASVSCGVALTATSGWLIVQASTMPVILTLLVAIVGVRAFGLFRPVFRYAERVVSHDVALAELVSRRVGLFAALIPLTPARLGRRSRSQVLTAAARDLDDVVDHPVRVTVPAASTVIATLVGALVAYWQLPTAGLAVAAGGLCVAAVALLGYAAEQPAQDRAVAERGRVRDAATTLAGNLLPVQAVTGRHREPDVALAQVLDAEAAHQRSEAGLIRARALGLGATWCVIAVTTALVAVLAVGALVTGDLSGPYAALVALVPMALADAWAGIPEVAGAHARSRSAAHRLAGLLDQEPAVAGDGVADVPTGPRRTLGLHAATASWQARHPAAGVSRPAARPDLPPLDLTVAPGDRIRLCGANGAGKSTALAVLARQLDPSSGSVTVSGDQGRARDVRDLDLGRTRALIAVVDDEPHAFAGSVRANLTLAYPEACDDDVLLALEAVGLVPWLATLPQGLDTPLTGLSGGKRSRLALARAVLSGRPVVLLDEPSAHLDDATAERALGGMLAHLGPARAVVLVSHTVPVVGHWADHPVGTLGRSRQADERAGVGRIG